MDTLIPLLVLLFILGSSKDEKYLHWYETKSPVELSRIFSNDLLHLIEKMEDDPYTRPRDWEALLDISRYSDQWYVDHHPGKPHPSPREEHILEILA